jgi:putative tryptophan/tyrosine transport system substrate-binding protein
MRRRDILKIIAGAVTIAPYRAAAQTAVRTYRIGTLTVGPPIPPTAGTGKILVDGLAKRGFNLGQNLAQRVKSAKRQT